MVGEYVHNIFLTNVSSLKGDFAYFPFRGQKSNFSTKNPENFAHVGFKRIILRNR